MPGVDVYYAIPMSTPVAYAIRRTIRRLGAVIFSSEVGGIQLSEDDFTIIFHEAGPYDELTHDVIVRVQLHAFADRLEDTDAKAGCLAEGMNLTLATVTGASELTTGVSLLVAEIGWGTDRISVIT